MNEKVDASKVVSDYIKHIIQQGENFKVMSIIFFIIFIGVIGFELFNLFHFPKYIFGFLISSIGLMLSFSMGNTLCFKYCHQLLIKELINSIDQESRSQLYQA